MKSLNEQLAIEYGDQTANSRQTNELRLPRIDSPNRKSTPMAQHNFETPTTKQNISSIMEHNVTPVSAIKERQIQKRTKRSLEMKMLTSRTADSRLSEPFKPDVDDFRVSAF